MSRNDLDTLTLLDLLSQNQLNADVLSTQTCNVYGYLVAIRITYVNCLLVDIDLLNIKHIHLIPNSRNLTLPSRNLASHSVVTRLHQLMTIAQLVVETLLVVDQHTVSGEVRRDVGDTALNRLNPLVRNVVGTTVVILRYDLLLDGRIDHLSIELVLETLVSVGALHRQCPAGTLLVALNPPTVENRELHYTVHYALLTAGTRCLQRTGRSIQPYVNALNHLASQLHIVVLQEEDLTYELRHCRYLNDALDQILTGLIVRVSLTCKYELYGTLLVVHDSSQTVQVGEQQVSTLIGCKAACETDSQHIGFQTLNDANHLTGRIQTYLLRIAHALADMVDQTTLQEHTLLPQLLVIDLMNLLPSGDIVRVTRETIVEVARVETAQVRCGPGREVNTIGYVANVQLILEVARPHIAQNILAHLTVQPRYTVHLLREVASQNAHRELLVGIVRVGLTEVDELIPSDTQNIGIVRHILTNHRFGECVVTCGYGGVGREQRRRTYNLHSLAERELTTAYHIADTLDADECSVTLVAVVNLLLDAHLAQSTDTTDTEQDLLLQTVLPIATIEVVGDRTVLIEVQLVVGVEQVEIGTTYLALPNTCSQRTARQSDLNAYPVTLLVTNCRDRQLVEVLSLVSSLLSTLCRQTLGEVTVAVQQTYGNHRNVLIAGLLQVVTSQDTQTTRVDLQRRVQTVLHREVSNLSRLRIGLLVHILLELSIYSVHLSQERLVLLQLLVASVANLVEQRDGVLVALNPQLVVDLLEQLASTQSPRPPQVVRQDLQCTQTLGQGLLDHQTSPSGLLANQLLTNEVDLLVVSATTVEHCLVGTCYRVLDCQCISIVIVLNEVLPESHLSYCCCALALSIYGAGVSAGHTYDSCCDLIDHLLIVRVGALDYVHALNLAFEALDPHTETCQRGGDGRNRECNAFERSVTPRLVVRRKYRSVHTYQQLVVVLIEDAVVTVQVARNEDNLNLGVLRQKYAAIHCAYNGIPILVSQIVGRVLEYATVDCLRLVSQVSLQILAGTVVASGNGDVSQHVALQLVSLGNLLQRLNKEVDTLVLELVATARTYDQGLLLELGTQASLSHLDHLLASLLTLSVELLILPYEIVLETVGSNHINLTTKQILALASSDVAHGEECVVVRCSDLLQRVLSHYVELASLVVSVETLQIAIEGEAVTGQAATHYGCVGSEARSHIGRVLAQIQTTARSHPLVEVSNQLIGRGAEVIYVALNHFTGSVAKQHGLDVVPLTADRVNAVGLPQRLQDFVLLGQHRLKINQNSDGRTLHLPAADTHTDTIIIESLAPHLQQIEVLLKFGIYAFAEYIRAQQNVLVAEFLGHSQGFGCNHSVDTAHLVAHLPTHFKQVIRSQNFVIIHTFFYVVNLQ